MQERKAERWIIEGNCYGRCDGRCDANAKADGIVLGGVDLTSVGKDDREGWADGVFNASTEVGCKEVDWLIPPPPVDGKKEADGSNTLGIVEVLEVWVGANDRLVGLELGCCEGLPLGSLVGSLLG